MLPLLDGATNSLGRDALLETLGRPNVTAPAWNAIRTTASNELGLWHYVEYSTGERELYNLDPAADPYEMTNIAGVTAYAEIEASLAVKILALAAMNWWISQDPYQPNPNPISWRMVHPEWSIAGR